MTFGSKFFFALRLLQTIFSLAALACGVYIAQILKQFAADADNVVSTVEGLLNGKDYASEVDGLINDFVNMFTGPPTRGYVLMGVAIWTLFAVTYLLVAQYSTKHPRLNKRSFRIPLEIFTVLFWFGGFCAIVSVAIEYESVCTPFDAFAEFPPIIALLSQIPIIGDLLTTCTVAVVASVNAALCWALWCITSMAACCMDRENRCCGKGRKNKKSKMPDSAMEEALVSTPLQPVGGASKQGFIQTQVPMDYRRSTYPPLPPMNQQQHHYAPLQTSYTDYNGGDQQAQPQTYHSTGDFGHQPLQPHQPYFSGEQPSMSRGVPVGRTVKRKQMHSPAPPPVAAQWRNSVPMYGDVERGRQGYMLAPQYAPGQGQGDYDTSAARPNTYWTR